jgi:hypothetical protein
MAYTPYGWQNPYYAQPMPDNLAQLRQQQMPPMMAPQPPQNPVAQSGVQWVSGEQEARNWMIAPNAAVALWDSSAPTVYLKKADASGKPSLTIYDLVERTETPRTATQEKGVGLCHQKRIRRTSGACGRIEGQEEAQGRGGRGR